TLMDVIAALGPLADLQAAFLGQLARALQGVAFRRARPRLSQASLSPFFDSSVICAVPCPHRDVSISANGVSGWCTCGPERSAVTSRSPMRIFQRVGSNSFAVSGARPRSARRMASKLILKPDGPQTSQ